MAIAFVGSWTSAQFNGNTGGSLGGRTSTAGNFVAITWSSTDFTPPTVTHSQAGTVQVAVAEAGNGGDGISIRYIENIVGGASHTITLTTAAGQFSTLNATEYSGVATTSSIDKTAQGTGSSTSLLSAATATTTQADELLIGVGTINSGTNSTWTATQSGTIRGQITDASVGSISQLWDRIVSATGTYQSGVNWSGASNAWIMQIATFKAAAGGGGPTAVAHNLVFLNGDTAYNW
jgi:hypothetical protein